MNEPSAKSGVSSTTVVWTFFGGVILGLCIGVIGGPVVERNFGTDVSKSPANARVTPGPPGPREGPPDANPTPPKPADPKPGEPKPTEPKPGESAKPTAPSH